MSFWIRHASTENRSFPGSAFPGARSQSPIAERHQPLATPHHALGTCGMSSKIHVNDTRRNMNLLMIL
jgi:hypothetical protein